MTNNNLKGLGIFLMQVVNLVSKGRQETFEEIEYHFDKSDLVEYLQGKYSDDFYIDFNNSIYNNAQINKYFYNFSGYIQGNERRKYAVMNDEDGLLLIISLISEKVEAECYKWTAEE
ncbi:MAG: hypothetical protein R3Y09_13940 [Clostridia bacterium]